MHCCTCDPGLLDCRTAACIISLLWIRHADQACHSDYIDTVFHPQFYSDNVKRRGQAPLDPLPMLRGGDEGRSETSGAGAYEKALVTILYCKY